MVKYFNFIKYLADVDHVVVSEDTECVIFYGSNREENSVFRSNSKFSIAQSTLILSKYNTDSKTTYQEDLMLATIIKPMYSKSKVVKGTDGLIKFLSSANIGVHPQLTVNPSDFTKVIQDNNEWFRKFVVGILAIKEVQITLYDEDMQVLECHYYGKEIHIIGIHDNNEDCFHCTTSGIEIMVGMTEMITKDVKNIEEFKDFLRHGMKSVFDCIVV